MVVECINSSCSDLVSDPWLTAHMSGYVFDLMWLKMAIQSDYQATNKTLDLLLW